MTAVVIAGENGVEGQWGRKRLAVRGPLGLAALALLVLSGMGWLFYEHTRESAAQHAAMTRASDELKCVLAIESYAERREAVISGSVCTYLLAAGLRGLRREGAR